MPFPLAHPAAVLPLRRRCPAWFNFPALVIGSLCPDFGYCFGRFHGEQFSHRFLTGSLGFCLPVGMFFLFVFYGCRGWFVQLLPGRYRQIFEPLCLRPASSLLEMMVSLLIGAWTHIFLDSMTHEAGWMVRHLPFLQATMDAGIYRIRICSLLYSISTFAGVAWLAYAYQNWLERAAESRRWIFPGFKWVAAVLSAAFTVLLSLANHNPSSPLALTDIVALTCLLSVLFFAVTGWALRGWMVCEPKKSGRLVAGSAGPQIPAAPIKNPRHFGSEKLRAAMLRDRKSRRPEYLNCSPNNNQSTQSKT